MITAGIITDGKNDTRVLMQILGIRASCFHHRVPYQIIVVGNSSLRSTDVQVVTFDEGQKPMAWITRKKNIITEQAKYENIAYMHDYYVPMISWADTIVNKPYAVGMHRIVDIHGKRYRDWSLDACLPPPVFVTHERIRQRLLPYDVKHLSKIMYISGGYWVAKKSVMEKFPLNEDLTAGMSEDIEWSHRIRKEHEFTMLDDKSPSMVIVKEGKNPCFREMDKDALEWLHGLTEDKINGLHEVSNNYYWEHHVRR